MKKALSVIKTFFKTNIYGMIIGASIVGGISMVNADYSFTSDNVYYDKSTSGGPSTNVKGSLDDLYSKIKYGNAGEGSILSGSTALVNGTKVTGTMKNNGAVSASLNTGTTSYTIPAGYHNGSGKVSITTQTKTVNSSTSAQVVTPDSGKLLSSVTVNAMASAGNPTITPNNSKGNNTATYNKYVGTVTCNLSNLYSKSQYDANYTSGYNAGKASVGLSIPYIQDRTVTSESGGAYFNISGLTVGKTYYLVGELHNASSKTPYSGYDETGIRLSNCSCLSNVNRIDQRQLDASSNMGSAMTMFFVLSAKATASSCSCYVIANYNNGLDQHFGGYLTAIGTNA